MSRRLFLDTTVFAIAYGEEGGASDLILDAAVAGEFTVVSSERLVEEALRVVGKLHGRRVAASLRSTIFEFPSLRMVARLEWERVLPLLKPFVRDPADGPHFAAARSGHAHALVSDNRRSVLPGMFSLMPLARPETVVKALRDEVPWPTPERLLKEWGEWARSSSRAPPGEGPTV
ncbi:MAG TPA: PIN domain-containing protein [Candidatus Thermoplasmatota archaeon]|nr:PIN domain-containing protein [Candidatus Thermoplasmatota archaeon]